LNVALGRAAARNVVIDEVLPEIQRRRQYYVFVVKTTDGSVRAG
jgi:hypothetical protein